MKKILLVSYTLILFGLFYGMHTFAKEPVNLRVYKNKLIQYHDSKEYEKDINKVIAQVMRYLNLRMEQLGNLDNNKKYAVVLDVDETALSTYHTMKKLDFGGTLDEIKTGEMEGSDSLIPATLKLFRYAKQHHLKIFFLTGRTENERAPTTRNLNDVGFENWDGLFMRNEQQKKMPASLYKQIVRKQLVEQGYRIILNVGDQKSDLVGGYADKSFKLPNPFYIIP